MGSIRGKAEVILEMIPRSPTKAGGSLMCPRADRGIQKSAKFFNVSMIKGVEGDDLALFEVPLDDVAKAKGNDAALKAR